MASGQVEVVSSWTLDLVMNAEYQPTSAALEAEASALLDQAVRRHFQMLTTSRVYSAVDRQWHDLANAEHQERHQQATQQLRQQEHTLRERIAETEQALLTQLQRNANQVAPGLMSVPWSDQAWKTLPVNSGPRPASHIRIGTLPSRFRDGNRNAPALLPLLDHAGWIVGCPQPEFIALVHSVLLRLFATLPLQRTAVTLFDPHLELPIGAFAAIRDASRKHCLPRSPAQPNCRTLWKRSSGTQFMQQTNSAPSGSAT